MSIRFLTIYQKDVVCMATEEEIKKAADIFIIHYRDKDLYNKACSSNEVKSAENDFKKVFMNPSVLPMILMTLQKDYTTKQIEQTIDTQIKYASKNK